MDAAVIPFSAEAHILDKVDVLVCGGGPAGIGAAVAAARLGARTMLVERFGHLGGVATNTLIGVWLGSYSRDGAFPVIGGVFQEIVDRLVAEGAALPAQMEEGGSRHIGYAPWHNRIVPFEFEPCKRVCEQLCQEAGVRLRYYTTVIGPRATGRHLEGAYVHSKGGLGFVQARCVVDATGDADVAFAAGCPTVKGVEGDGGMAPGSLILVVENVDYEAFERYCRETGDVRLRNVIASIAGEGEWPFSFNFLVVCELPRRGRCFLNGIPLFGVDGTNADSLTRAAVKGRHDLHLFMGLLRRYFPGFQEARLAQSSYAVGIRETRRIIGHYMIQDEDLIEGRSYEDTIALSGYRWDMASPAPARLKRLEEVPRDRPPADEQPMEAVAMARTYTEIPYRSLLPQGTDNLLVAGRCLSASRNALGPLRVMPACFATGQAAGAAAALAARQDVPVASLDVGHLQAVLVAQGAILNPREG